MISSMMDLKNIQWAEFMFIDIFEIKNGFYNKKPNPSINGKIPFIGATQNNNGITEFYTFNDIESNSKVGYGKNEAISKKIFNGNCIAVTNNGSVGFAYYQIHNFTCSHDVNPLYLKNYELNEYIAKFLISAIEMQRVCFEYARKWRPKRMVKSKILLPINSKGEPNYSFMEQFIRLKETETFEKINKHINIRVEQVKDFKKVEPLIEKVWGEFFIEDVAQIISGRDIYQSEREKGNIPYVSATANNNGVGYYVGNTNETLEENCLSVNRNGSVGYSFYHQYKALFSNDCRKLRLKNKSPFVGKFISRIITQQKDKYGYGYKMGTGRIKRQKILLPVDKIGQPDYEYMENYIKRIEYEKLKQYLEYQKLKIKT
jgi:hypothetical protein